MIHLPISSLQKKIIGIVFVLLVALFLTSGHHVQAQADPGASAVQADQTTPAPVDPAANDGKWVEDKEVTFVGKTATRADSFLDWTLQHYDWLCIKQDANGACDNANNPLTQFWILVRDTVYILMVLFVLVTAFVMIITRGQNTTIMKFVPRFIFIIILVTLSFSLVQFIYQISDIIQGFLYRINDGGTIRQIGSADLLHISFGYDFVGYRLLGDAYEESAFISLLLVRLTAFTYYTMTGILLIRKIILWFFIILSPVFPLLLFYAPIRNTAKVWIGEFFRWLLYGPLFALFLHGLVAMWSSPVGIPLPFTFPDPTNASANPYTTSINILLGGPGQKLGINNSLNNGNTFAQYVVALLMLWVVTLLPFLLLNIFLDYLGTISLRDNVMIKQLAARSMGLLNPRFPSSPQSPLSPSPQGAGLARALPFLSKGDQTTRTIPVGVQSSISSQRINMQDIKSSSDVMKLTNLQVPKMRDIARYETSMMSHDSSHKEEVSHVSSTLKSIANPSLATSPAEREKFTQLKEKLVQEKQKGDPLASSILSASSTLSTSTSSTTTVNKSTVSGRAPSQAIGAQSIVRAQQMNLPVVNRVQQVSIEDYEEVRKMWEENYQNLEPPKGINGIEVDRKTWISNDMQKINQAISLLTSVDPEKTKQGMNMVANILPFLLIGGFSRAEVIAYLKAKQEAGKSVLNSSDKKEDEEDTMVERSSEKHEKAAVEHQEEKLPAEEPKYLGDENPKKEVKN